MAIGPIEAMTLARIDRIRRRVIADAARILRGLPRDGKALDTSTADNLRTLAGIRSACVSLLRNAGREEVIPAADRGVADALDAAGGDRGSVVVGPGTMGVGVTLTARQRASVLNVASGALDAIGAAFGDAQDLVRRLVDDAINAAGQRTIDAFAAAMAERIDVAFSRARVAASTAILGAYRLAVVQLAEKGAKSIGEPALFLYDGPDDKKNRPFCAAHVGRVYSLSRIRRMNNGQGLSVEAFCGGFGCRHRHSPISLEDALAEGYDIVR